MESTTLSALDQYLSFNIDSEVYALDITRVREILEFTTVTKVPRMPAFMRGVINLRGAVVPVIDMRARFGLPEAPVDKSTCIIITDVEIEGTRLVLGAVADSVQEVFQFEDKHLERLPRMGGLLEANFLKGMGTHDGGFVQVLELDRLFSAEEAGAINNSTTAPVA